MPRPPTHLQLLRAGRDRAADRDYDERRRRDPALAAAARIRRSMAWQSCRRAKLERDPLCERCEAEGRSTFAAQVHHRIPLAQRPDLAFDHGNLMSVCTRCHARLEHEEGGARHG